MKKNVNNFDVLKKMSEDNNPSFKMYPHDSNFMGAHMGKKGWGYVKIAVDNDTILKMAIHNKTIFNLLAYDSDSFKETKEKMEEE
jgi:hypothetical protein